MYCTICKSNNTEVAFEKQNYQILHCKDCDHLFTGLTLTPEKVEIIYSDNYFFGGGDGYADYAVEKDMLIKRGEYYADKLSKFMVQGKVLDIGSAAGFILKGFENKGWVGTGIEPNNSMTEYGKKVMGVKIIRGTIENVILRPEFDLAIMIQVVAHLFDLNSSIHNIYTGLKPDGFLLIETWNKDSFTARLLGKYWHEFSPPSTLNYFSKKTLIKLLVRHNFTLVAKGTPRKKIHSKHAQSLLRHKLLEMPGLKWMAGLADFQPNNKLLPYPVEDLCWFLFKKAN